MSGDLVAEAKEALAGITPGPWAVNTEGWAAVSSGPDSVIHAACTTFCDECGHEFADPDAFVCVSAEDAEFIAASPDLVSRLADEVERLRDSRDHWKALWKAAVEDATTARTERDEALAAIERVQGLVEGWLTEPCVGGYRIPNGNDDNSQCLHCGADVLLEALDGGESDE